MRVSIRALLAALLVTLDYFTCGAAMAWTACDAPLDLYPKPLKAIINLRQICTSGADKEQIY